MVLGSSAATSRAVNLLFTMELDRNSLRKAQRGVAIFKKDLEQFERVQQENVRSLDTQEKAQAQVNREVAKAAAEFGILSVQQENASKGLLKTANAADVAASSLRAATRQSRAFADSEQAIRGLSRTAGLVPGVDPRAGMLAAELASLPREFTRLSASLKALPSQARAAAASIGVTGLGLGLAIAALAAAALIGARRMEKFKQEFTAVLEGQARYFELVKTGTIASISLQRDATRIELETAQAKKDSFERDLAEVQSRIDAADRVNLVQSLSRDIPIAGDVAGRIRPSVVKDTGERQAAQEQLERVNDEIRNLTATLESTERALVSGAVLFNSLDENQKALNRAREQELVLINESRIASVAARAAKERERDILFALREEEERLAATRKRDFNRANEQRREAERAAEAKKQFDLLSRAAQKFAQIQQRIADIQARVSERLAQIAQRAADKRAEIAIRLEQNLRTAAIAGAEARLKIAERFQDARQRLTRTFNRALFNATAERDALAAFLAGQQRDDSEADARQSADRALEQQKRAEAERVRIIRQGNANALRTTALAALRQSQAAVAAARRQISIQNRSLAIQTQTLAVFAVQGTQLVQSFVRNSLGALSALASAAGAGGGGSANLNNAIDKRIEQTFGGGGGGGANFAR